MSNPKIAIGYIHGDFVDGPFHHSLMNFTVFDSQNRRLLEGEGWQKALYLDDKRNELTRDFLKTRADWLMSIDTDIEWTPEDIYQLFDEAYLNDRQILAGMYFSFLVDNMLLPVWFSGIDDGGCLKTFGSFKPDEIVVPLTAAGMGFTLIRRDVFEGMEKEYGHDFWTWFGRDPYFYKIDGKLIPQRYGEDTCFCVRAGRCGFQTWGDKRIQVGHWKKTRLDFALFRALTEWARQHGMDCWKAP